MRMNSVIFMAALSLASIVAHAGNLTIDQSGQQFSEKSISLKSGDSLIFANRDDVSHNITVVNDDDDTADLGLQKPGQNLTYKFDKTGRFKIRCSIHPSMKMTVSVK